MEDHRPPVGDEGKESSHAQESIFARLFESLREADESDTEEDEEETGEVKSKKSVNRFQRFFNGIFRRSVHRPEKIMQTQESLPEQKEKIPLRVSEEQLDQVSENLEQEKVEHEKSFPNLDNDTSNPETDVAAETLSDDTQPIPNESPNRNSRAAESSDSINESLNTDTTDIDPEGISEYHEPEIDQSAVMYERNAAVNPVVPSEVRATLPVEKEVIHRTDRRGMAILTVLLGAEYWARRRADREIKRDLKKLRDSKPVDAPQTNAKTTERASFSSQEVRYHSQDREPKRVPKLVEKQLSAEPETPFKLPILERKIMPTPVLVEKKQTTLSVEAEPATIKRPEVQENIPPEKLPESLKALAAPELVLEKVAEAADKDLPIEKDYERRHEVKDASTKVTTGAASVGAILSGMGIDSSPSSSSQPALSSKNSQADSGKQSKAPLTNPPNRGMYQQAMQTGFWAAIAIIIFIMIIGL